MEFVVAVFKHRIQDGCNLIGAEDICSSYETTFLRGGEIQYSLWLTDYEVTPWDLKVELALNQRLLIDHDLLKSVESGGIVIVRWSCISAIVCDPPQDLRRVSLRLVGAKIVVPRGAAVRT